jgi:predicted phosphate transport protein (TIGR00153 family)
MEKHIENLFVAEEEVDKLRTNVFTELSKGAALVADYREDLLHLVKRLDTLADHTKDAARCLRMLGDAKIPEELCKKTVFMTGKLVETASALRRAIEKITSNPPEAVREASQVEEFEHDLDQEYLAAKSLFVKYGEEINCGAMVIFDDLVEFIEHAADMCADTADYIAILSSRE